MSKQWLNDGKCRLATSVPQFYLLETVLQPDRISSLESVKLKILQTRSTLKCMKRKAMVSDKTNELKHSATTGKLPLFIGRIASYFNMIVYNKEQQESRVHVGINEMCQPSTDKFGLSNTFIIDIMALFSFESMLSVLFLTPSWLIRTCSYCSWPVRQSYAFLSR